MSRAIERRDAIIVGAGPAGSTLAWKMASAGWKPIVLDRTRFPREKLCAGWITPPVLRALDLDVEEYRRHGTLQEFHGFAVSRLGGRPILADFGCPVSYGIIRREFDHYLLQRSGAECRENVRVKQIERRDGGWLVNGELWAPLLIGAAGHFCPVARLLGADLKREKKLSTLELERKLSDEELAGWNVSPLLPEIVYFDDIRGYGWVFRKGNFINVGIGRTQNRFLQRFLDLFLEEMTRRGTIPADRPFSRGEFRGHPYKLHFVTPRTVVGESVLLVGDAAGLTFNYSGEGIRPAVESAILAWETIRRAGNDVSGKALDGYRTQLYRCYGKPVTGWRFRLMESLPPSLFQSIGRALFAVPYLTRRLFVQRMFLRVPDWDRLPDLMSRHGLESEPSAETAHEESALSGDHEEILSVPIEDFIDLHTFSPGEIPQLVKGYLEEAYRSGFREVRIIHGKGTGFQRERVRQVLAEHPLVLSFRDAPPERGGWGATIARLGRTG